MYIRQKVINGSRYFYLVKNTRVGKKIIQTIIAYLGKHSTINRCKAYHVRRIQKLETEKTSLLGETKKVKSRLALLNKWILDSQLKINELQKL